MLSVPYDSLDLAICTSPVKGFLALRSQTSISLINYTYIKHINIKKYTYKSYPRFVVGVDPTHFPVPYKPYLKPFKAKRDELLEFLKDISIWKSLFSSEDQVYLNHWVEENGEHTLTSVVKLVRDEYFK